MFQLIIRLSELAVKMKYAAMSWILVPLGNGIEFKLCSLKSGKLKQFGFLESTGLYWFQTSRHFSSPSTCFRKFAKLMNEDRLQK